MRGRARLRISVVAGSLFLAILACSRGGPRWRATAASPPPEVVKQLQVPPSPYYIIYSPPANLAKPPDTTAHAPAPARKPSS